VEYSEQYNAKAALAVIVLNAPFFSFPSKTDCIIFALTFGEEPLISSSVVFAYLNDSFEIEYSFIGSVLLNSNTLVVSPR